ncbi:Synaptonemal complex central element protein 1 [Heterocephalus glaber]|uniref:Synaptonemal complex central element protein 1 n=1 Tax=Heterocephalus glaber TaxID=10181 RepID=G5BV22_HETGA|nr:Synaptonemal complex central element protein 1 [Heterocephalus glaber]
MAAKPRPSPEEPAGVDGVKGVEGARGKDTSTQKIDDLMEIVKKRQKAGSLEPRIEFLINWINEVQQAKKKTIEELGEAENVWDALQKELDSLHEEKVHLKEILNKKQESLRILQLHCQEKENRGGEEQRQLRLDFEEQLEALIDQHKDLWEFHRPKQLAREICALDSNKEQLLWEEKLVEEAAAAVQLFKENRKAEELLEATAQHHQQLKQRCQQLQEKRQRLKEELEKYRVQAQSMQEEGAGPQGMASPKVLAVFEEEDPELPTKEGLIPS